MKIPNMTKALPSVCYLCGESLAEPISWDHAPMKQLFADAVRKTHNPSKLLTIPVHKNCNEAYQLDEDYFVSTLMPFAHDSYAGSSVYQEILQKFRRGENVPLLNKVLAEFDPRPSGLILPNNLMAMRFEGARVHRIAWKIVRGLYFHLFNVAYPEDWTVGVTVTTQARHHQSIFKTSCASRTIRHMANTRQFSPIAFSNFLNRMGITGHYYFGIASS